MPPWIAIALVMLAACERRGPKERAAAPVTPSAPAPAADAGGCTLAANPLRRPMPKRVVAIGDLHGDLGGTRAALRAAGAIDASDRWIGGDLVVVQTGDVLDRGDDEQAILDLIFRLEGEAAAAGGAVIMLLGNHELMNAAGDFRYVTPGAVRDFEDTPVGGPRYANLPEAARRRMLALGPGGTYAKQLAAHDVVAIIGDTVFSHAGVLGEWASRVEELNLAARCWLAGQGGGPDDEGSVADPRQARIGEPSGAPPPRGPEAWPASLDAPTSPVWTRDLGLEADCAAARTALDALGAKRMVVGHTVQPQGVNSACDGAVWRIDVGLAHLYGGPIEVLEVTAAGTKVLRGSR